MPWCACTEGTWCLMHRCMRRRHITVPYRDLGIMVSGDLSWSSHLNHICSKAYTALYRIKHAFPSVIASLKKQLYITIVRSNLYYGSQLRRPHIKNILLLERAQRRVTKHILADYSSNYKLQRPSTKTITTSSYVLVEAQQRHVSNQGTKNPRLCFLLQQHFHKSIYFPQASS